MNLPNKLTLLRIIMIPFFIACFYIPTDYRLYIAAAVFIAAYITDAVDGHLARKTGQITDFGKLMDPIADKLLSSAAFVMLTAVDGMVHPVAAIIILSREFLISGLRLVSADKGVVIAASKWGKLKTVSQAICIPAVMLAYAVNVSFGLPLLITVADVLVWISAFLAVASGADYMVKYKSFFSAK